MKRRILCLMASLLLCGAVSAQNWGTPDPYAKSSNTPIVAQVVINGETQTAGTLGAFVGDQLRGISTAHTDGNYWIQVFYDAGTTENISFKYYVDSQEYDYSGVTVSTCEEGYGTPTNPFVLACQSTTLASGWSWWSSYVEITDGAAALTTLENSLGAAGIRIQSRNNGFVDGYFYNGETRWFGTLASINNEQMYQVHTSGDCNSIMTGAYASTENHAITINNNWNWIGYPCHESMSLNNAFSSDFIPEPNDQIKSKSNGFAYYIVSGTTSYWWGTLNSFEPGQGYMYLSNSNNTKTLTFQSARGESLILNNSFEDNIFISEEKVFADNMTVTAVVELEGNELRDDNYELAAFVGDECRGSVKLMYVEPLNRYIAFLLIAGDKEESLRFALADRNGISWSSDNLMYSTNAVIGNPSEPAILHFGPLGLDDNIDNLVNVYPNPSKDIFNIEGNGIRKVEIINTYGQVVYSKEVKEENLQINMGGYASGAYLLRVVTISGVSIKQLIKK